MTSRRARDLATTTAFFALLLLGWEWGVRWSGTKSYLLAPPSAIAEELWRSRDALAAGLLETLTEVFWGFVAALAVGVPISAFVFFSNTARRTVYPLLVALQSIPKVGLAPILVAGLGYGLSSKLTMAFLFAFFPVVVAGMGGLASTPAHLEEHFRALRASRWQTFWRLRLPCALPTLLDGCKVAMPLAVIGAIVGEFVGSSDGLGNLILTASGSGNTALTFAALLTVTILSLLLFYGVEYWERFVWWRAA
ncbi:ABC transporter permease [Sphingomonas sp. AR_OL41]|uniref:ABC transporter permease n=1 Tax=Sphingomonas sp. AR_OL41 TaxID=3042729 RepID=UPI002480B580|nr:ABC transporter permease [Sphingomonas sp. AR_OL41]MDH7972094.1 ABC transporter permease [Sphingomonas sp. AR_OL41]